MKLSRLVGLAALIAWIAAPAISLADDDECLECHSAGADVVELEPHQQVAADAWMASIHAEMEFACTDCHEGKEDYPHEEAEPALCSNCHEDAMEAFGGSVHDDNMHRNGGSSPFPQGDPCVMCHGVHDVRAVSDPDSRVAHANIPTTCGSCHGDLAIVQANQLSTAPFDNYQNSVHGLRLSDPDKNPAVCTDCHGAHDVVRGNHPESPINPFRIPSTCGQCHDSVAEEYLSSVHGAAFERGVTTSPVCTDCHGIHSIRIVTDPDAPEREQHLVRTTCPACHASEALMSEYGVAPTRVRTYQASYHGLANQRGNTAVADCASCHGIHAIYPSTDPRSTVAPERLQETCGSCHPGANVEFTRSPVHFTTEGEATADVVITMWVKRIYWALLLAVLGGMVAHNLVILSWYIRRKWKDENEKAGRVRFTTDQTIQHATLVITFITLVISGFMLAYPDTWWSQMLVQLGVTESIRRWVHRVAAIGMILASFYHLYWILFTSYGRAELKRIAPGLRDVREFLQNMRFHLGQSHLHAAFAKYDYPAKAEYWALVWGTIVMAVTGLILWFPVVATSFLPFWIVKVSEVIHLFEAWLATLAILIFHFFYVIGHPEVFPINLAMFHGRMPEETARHHHPAWVETEAADIEAAKAAQLADRN